MNVIIAKTAIALPRSIGPENNWSVSDQCSLVSALDSPHMSANTPGLLDNAAEQKVPVKNRPTRSPAKLFVNAHKKVKAKYPRNVI